MKTIIAKFSGGGVFTSRYHIVDRPKVWHEENVPGFEGSRLTQAPEFSVKSYLQELAAAAGQTVEITEEGEAAFAHR